MDGPPEVAQDMLQTGRAGDMASYSAVASVCEKGLQWTGPLQVLGDDNEYQGKNKDEAKDASYNN